MKEQITMPNHFTVRLLTLAVGAALLSTCPHAAAAKPTTTMVSVNSDGVQGNSHSSKYMSPGISGDGRYSVFSSMATNLVENDTNGVEDIFVHDARTGETTRVSVNSNGDQANGESSRPVISADGRYVAFTSDATNLVTGDTNVKGDIFVHDCRTGETTRASVDSNGVQGDGHSNLAAISADGRYVAFHSFATQLTATTESTQDLDIFVRDRTNNTTTLVSKAHSGNAPGNNTSAHPQISGNGRYVTFYSRATDLTTATDTNGQQDVFIRDLQTQTTSLISATPAGTAGNLASSNSAISYDGRYVAFDSTSSNLVDGDTNNTSDIFLLDRNTNHTIRISGDIGGAELQQDSYGPSISADGRYISYILYDSYPGPIFRYDRLTGKAARVDVNNNGDVGNEESDAAVISADGNYVIFYSWASNLVDGDTNDRSDVFVRGPMNAFPWPMFLPALTGGQK